MLRTITLALVLSVSIGARSHAQEATNAHEVAAALIARDNVTGYFVDASTDTVAIVSNPQSRLTCAGVSLDASRLWYQPPNPSIPGIGCRTNVGESTFIARATLIPAGFGDVAMTATRGAAEISGEQINGVEWTGARVEVGGGHSPPHPPYEILRYQGVRDGQPIYLRYAWAQVGDWIYMHEAHGPLSEQIAIEGISSLAFYNQLLLANDISPNAPAQ